MTFTPEDLKKVEKRVMDAIQKRTQELLNDEKHMKSLENEVKIQNAKRQLRERRKKGKKNSQSS